MSPMVATPQAAQTESTTIPRKARRVLGLDLHTWEVLMILSLLFAALAAFAVVATTSSVVILQRGELARLNKESEELRKGAEELKSANLALEKSIAPRRLSEWDVASLAAKLSAFAGKTVRIKSYSLDGEAAVLALQFIESTRRAVLRIFDKSMSQQTLGVIAFGVWISGTNDEMIAAFDEALPAEIARARGVPPAGAGMWSASDDEPPPGGAELEVFVGAKPLRP